MSLGQDSNAAHVTAETYEQVAEAVRDAVPITIDAAPKSGGRFAVGVSLIAHVTLAAALAVTATQVHPRVQAPIKIKISKVEKPKPPPPPPEVKKEEPKPPPPPPPEVKKKPKPKPKKVITERKPTETPVPKAAPIQGLSKSAVVPGGHGIAAPVGNTLMVADDGKRHKAEEVKPLAPTEDLSADAKLVSGSVTTPKYTDDAIDANLEGTFTVDVYVDGTGKVTQVDLRKKVGYGMDARLIEAAKQARFTPRKNKLGQPEAGWSEIRFRLEIPG